MRTALFILHAGVLALATTAVRPAFAQAPDESRATAEKLFDEASQLMGKRDFATACPKLEEVVRLQPQGIGAKLSLADCYVGEGKLASAYAALGQAADAATRANQQDRANLAIERIRSIEPRLSKISIIVPDELAALPGLTISRNGVAISLDQLKAAAPVDRGSYGIVANAPGRRRFEKTLTVADEGTSVTVTISLPLEQSRTIAPPPPEPPPTHAATSPWSAPRIAGVVMAATGFAVLGAGLGVGIHGVYRVNKGIDGSEQAIATHDEVLMAAAIEEYDSGKTQSTAGWTVFGIGAAATLAGVILAIAAPDAADVAEGHAMVAPWASDSSLGFTVLGQF